MPTLLCYAAPAEAGPLALGPAPAPHRYLELGVGKTAAAVSLSRELYRLEVAGETPALVLLFGVAGSYPGGPEVGSLALCSNDRLLDEGVQTPDQFLNVETLGLGATAPLSMDPQWTTKLAAALEAPCVRAGTVSTCAGSNALATQRAALDGAVLESMEGAAVAWACRQAELPLVQLRSVSNRCGNRDQAGWDLPAACEVVQQAVQKLCAAELLP